MLQSKTTEELILVEIFFLEGVRIMAWWVYDEFYKN
tara:strand:+ start:319 stop:426 length:108 start_codon:yes stop_codon:yes gene_type:complete